ncbi:MAG: DUF4133 domain-containing protein [Bacteroidota bacterium]
MKKKTYKLKDLAYMGLSLNYLGLMAATIILMIITAGITSSGGNWLGLILSLLVGSGITYFIYHTGIKYGQYGLIILFAKLLQPKHIKNDFPLITKNLVVENTQSIG